MTEIEQLQYEDALVMFNSLCEQYGARSVLKDFKTAFPEMFQEILVQSDRIHKERQIPVLFLKPHAGTV